MGTAGLSSSARASNSRPTKPLFSETTERPTRRIGLRRVRKRPACSRTHFEGNEAHERWRHQHRNPSRRPIAQSVFFNNTAQTGNGGAVYIVHGTTKTSGEWKSSAEDVFEENTHWKVQGVPFLPWAPILRLQKERIARRIVR